MKSPGAVRIRWLYKPIIHGLALIPFGVLLVGLLSGSLGANPVETITHVTGEWGLRLLLVTLMVTPLARLTRSGWLASFRRLLGLYCFFYVLLHFMVYLILDLSFDFGFLWEDVRDRPYLTVGFLGFVILLLLAVTSPLAIRRRMGRFWNSLHRLVFVAGGLAVVHFLWSTKADDVEPMVYGAVLAVLIAYRLMRRRASPNIS